MKILREYGINGDKKLRYNLCEAAGANMSDMVGQKFGVKAYLLTEVINADGEPVKALKVITDDGEIVGTRSASFISGFERFLECMESDQCDAMEIVQARSKAGRNYLTFKAPMD